MNQSQVLVLFLPQVNRYLISSVVNVIYDYPNELPNEFQETSK